MFKIILAAATLLGLTAAFVKEVGEYADEVNPYNKDKCYKCFGASFNDCEECMRRNNDRNN